MEQEPDRCPECFGEDFHNQSPCDRFPKRSPKNSGEEPIPVARTFWLECEDCGYVWPFTKALAKQTKGFGNMRFWPLACLVITAGLPMSSTAAQFQVEKVTPQDQAKNVELAPLIQIHTSEAFDPKTVTRDAFQLLDAKGERVPIRVSSDLGGVVTVSVMSTLLPDQEYRLKVLRGLKSSKGKSIKPFESSFRTTANPDQNAKQVPKHFRFTKTRIDKRDGVCGIALSPFGDLFSCTWDGGLYRQKLDEAGNPVGPNRQVFYSPDQRFLAMVVDPKSKPNEIKLWLSHDGLSKLSLGPNDFSGLITLVTIRQKDGMQAVEIEGWIRGLPTGDHPATGLIFGPSGKLYVSQGALTMLGDKPDLKETPLSAATLEVDLAGGKFPVDVHPDRYNHLADDAPVKLFASGIREAYDLCWHSNGQLYASVNMNDTKEKTPANEGLPAVSVRPSEMMLRIVRGKYYGHPNPSRNQWVLLGGNPTKGIDPWEVPELPVGTMPDPNFDPALLIRDMEKDKGPSADGVVEWTNNGPLKGRLIFCFYTATRGIHTYQLSADGKRIIDHQPLLDVDGKPLQLGAPLDVAFHPGGWLYVADFSALERGDSGKNGGIWKVEPVVKTPRNPNQNP